MTDHVITADMVRLMREASGMGMADCAAAARKAFELYDGDLVLALRIRHAAGFAVNIKSRNPDMTDAQARDRWNLEHAMWDRDGMANRSEAWAQLDAISNKYRGGVA